MIQLGGGFKKKDLEKYFKDLKIKRTGKIAAVSIDGGKNKPEGTPDSADGEVMLDIEVSAAIAPDADIVVYFAPNTDRGFIDAITSALYDKKYKNTIISISWGATEDYFTDQAKKAFEFIFADAASKGISVFCASGDNGSTDGDEDGKPHVDFPGSAPHAVSCGGTTLIIENKKIKETVWNNDSVLSASGGGFSDYFERPQWQKKIKMSISASTKSKGKRGVPDVSAVANPNTGYEIFLYDQWVISGGTSAVAPLWAGLTALLNEKLGKNLGFISPTLYKAVETTPKIFRDITEGNNGHYKALPGWDACTGLGVPNGEELLRYLSKIKEN